MRLVPGLPPLPVKLSPQERTDKQDHLSVARMDMVANDEEVVLEVVVAVPGVDMVAIEEETVVDTETVEDMVVTVEVTEDMVEAIVDSEEVVVDSVAVEEVVVEDTVVIVPQESSLQELQGR
jgi:hypothetical protein